MSRSQRPQTSRGACCARLATQTTSSSPRQPPRAMTIVHATHSSAAAAPWRAFETWPWWRRCSSRRPPAANARRWHKLPEQALNRPPAGGSCTLEAGKSCSLPLQRRSLRNGAWSQPAQWGRDETCPLLPSNAPAFSCPVPTTPLPPLAHSSAVLHILLHCRALHAAINKRRRSRKAEGGWKVA